MSKHLNVVLHEVPFDCGSTFRKLLLPGIEGGSYPRFQDAHGADWLPDSKIPTGFPGPLHYSAVSMVLYFLPFENHGGNRGVCVEYHASSTSTFPEFCTHAREQLARTVFGPHVLGFRMSRKTRMVSETDATLNLYDMLSGKLQVVLDESVAVVHDDPGAYGYWKLDVKASNVPYNPLVARLVDLPLPFSRQWTYRFTDGRGADLSIRIPEDFVGPLHVQAFLNSSSADAHEMTTFVPMANRNDCGLLFICPEVADLTYACLYRAIMDTLRGLGREGLFAPQTIEEAVLMATNTKKADLRDVFLFRGRKERVGDPTPISDVATPLSWNGQETAKWKVRYLSSGTLLTGGSYSSTAGARASTSSGGIAGGASASAGGGSAGAGAGGAAPSSADIDLLGGRRRLLRHERYGGISRLWAGPAFDGYY